MTSPGTPGVRLAHFAAQSRSTQLPGHVMLKTKLQIIDTLGAIVSGSALEAGRVGQKYAKDRGGREEASVLGTTLRVPVVEAALANGMAAHADESDDSHESSQTHPGCGVLSALLAVAEWKQSSGQDFIVAVNLAYEVTIRLGETLAPSFSFARSSLSCHAIGPLFGAGFGVGSLLGFNENQFLILLNYLAQEASGLTTWRLDGTHSLKSYVFAGMPCSNAVKAALLVESGFTGSGDVLNPSDRNFFDAISPHKTLHLDLSTLGTDFRILETDIKKYPVGFPIAAPLSALENILLNTSIQAKDIDYVNIFYMDDWYKVIGDQNRMPDLNLRHCLAATIVEGHLTFQTSHDPSRMAQPAILEIGRKINFLDAKPGQDRFEARLEIGAGGMVYRAEQGLYVLGRKENPMSAEQVWDKATNLLTTVISQSKAVEAIRIVKDLHNQHDLVDLVNTLTTGERHG